MRTSFLSQAEHQRQNQLLPAYFQRQMDEIKKLSFPDQCEAITVLMRVLQWNLDYLMEPFADLSGENVKTDQEFSRLLSLVKMMNSYFVKIGVYLHTNRKKLGDVDNEMSFCHAQLDRLEQIINFCHLYITFTGKKVAPQLFAKLQPILQTLIQVNISSNRQASTVPPEEESESEEESDFESDCDEPWVAVEERPRPPVSKLQLFGAVPLAGSEVVKPVAQKADALKTLAI